MVNRKDDIVYKFSSNFYKTEKYIEKIYRNIWYGKYHLTVL